MSHFTVLVVCPAGTTQDNVDDVLEESIAPFNSDVGDDSPYSVFHDVTDECRSEYEGESVERIVMPDGRLLLPWDDLFQTYRPANLVAGADASPEDSQFSGIQIFGTGTHVPPEDLEKRMVPFNETYPTLADFMTGWHGYRYNEQQGSFGYYHNPNGKWDWWSLGGRWQGLLTAKPMTPDFTVIYGEPGVFGSIGDEYKRPGFRLGCDGCRKGDLDFDWAREENVRSVQMRWDQMIAGGHQNDLGLRQFQYGFDKDSTLEQELQEAQNCHPFNTFALLKNGVWYERGEMGWFASVKNDKGRNDWRGELHQLWDDIADDQIVVVVDCHI